MTDLPLVSVVTPSFNQGRFLQRTIQSVLEQDYPRIEYILIDGGSTDESLSVIQRYRDRLAYWETQPDRGQAHAINKGLERSTGEILGWLNSDDILLRGTVRRIVEIFSENPKIDVVYGRLERIDEYDRLLPTPILPKDKLDFSRQLILGECIVNQPGSFWRREIMGAGGLLDERLHYALDYEYWIRLALIGARFQHIPEVLARFRLSSGSKTVSEAAVMAREQLQILEEVASRPGLADELGLEPDEIQRQVKHTQARINLHGFYAELKRGELAKALHWFGDAVRADPFSIIDRRWLDLAVARLRR